VEIAAEGAPAEPPADPRAAYERGSRGAGWAMEMVLGGSRPSLAAWSGSGTGEGWRGGLSCCVNRLCFGCASSTVL